MTDYDFGFNLIDAMWFQWPEDYKKTPAFTMLCQ